MSLIAADGGAYALLRRQAALLREPSLRRRFVMGAFWSLVGAVGSRALSQVGAIVAARSLTAGGFGELSVVQNTVSVFGMFAGLGLGLTATKHIAEYRTSAPHRAGQYVALALLITLLTGVAMSLAFIDLAPWLATRMFAAPQLGGELQLGTGLLFFGALNGTQIGVLTGSEAFSGLAAVSTARGLLGAVGLALGAVALGVGGAIGGQVVAEGLSACLLGLMVLRESRKAAIPLRFGGLRREVPMLWRFSLPALLSSMATLPAMWLANVRLVQQPAGYAELGLFTAANRWSLLILFVPSSVASIILPLLANLHGAGDVRAYRRVFRANVLLTFGCVVAPAIVIVAFAAPIMALYGAEYRQGSLVLVVLAVATLPTALNNVLGQVVVSSGAIWWRFAFDVCLAILLLASAWWLIPRWGAVGMAGAYALAFGVTSCGLIVFIRHHFRAGQPGVGGHAAVE